MDLFKKFHERSAAASAAVVHRVAPSVVLDLARLAVQVPRHREHGEMANNAPFIVAPQAGMTPAAFAEAFIAEFAGDPDFTVSSLPSRASSTPGCRRRRCSGVVGDVLRQGEDFGRSDMGRGERVNVEYVSANPTGPLHVGHCRGAVFGDALANLLAKMGFAVAREYYINDAGAQIDVLARSAYLRYREAVGETIAEIPAGLYPGEYLKPVGQALAERHGALACSSKPEAEWLPLVRVGRDGDDARPDQGRSRRARHPSRSVLLGGALHRDKAGRARRSSDLKQQGHVYKGRLPPPKGADAGGLGRPRADAVPRHRHSATTSTGRWSSRTAATPISPRMSLTARQDRRAASGS